MPQVTREQIERAKECDLLTYLRENEPQELKQCGKNEYCTTSHESLKISNGRWNWHSRGIGGRTALDYLVKVCGMDFTEAVGQLAGNGESGRGTKNGQRKAERTEERMRKAESGQMKQVREQTGRAVAGKEKIDNTEPVRGQTGRAEAGQERPQEIRLPESDSFAMRITGYLQKRGIDMAVIAHCRSEGTLYEDRQHHNCVFVGRDKKGMARYAALRGTAGDFRGELAGSDKRYGFTIPSDFGCGSDVKVAESPIDALSLATMDRQDSKDWRLTNYLSLGGTSPLALIQFLKDYPYVKNVYLCLDNDKAGREGMARIRAALEQEPELKGRKLEIRDCPPPLSCGKDYNDLLRKKIAERDAERKQRLAEKLHGGEAR